MNEIKKKIMVLLEFRPKRFEMCKPIDKDFLESIKILPLYGGGLNKDMNFTIAIQFPEELEVFKKIIKVVSVTDDGIIEDIKEI